MSQLRFYYQNAIDAGSIKTFSDEITTLPAVNVQNEIKSKIWKTNNGFVIGGGYNNTFSFRDTATESITSFLIASATYTGSGLATVIQSGINTVGNYESSTVVYDATSTRYTITADTATTFELLFNLNSDRSVGTIIGFDKSVVYSGLLSYESIYPTKGNEQWIVFSNSSVFSAQTIIVDKHNLSTGTVINVDIVSTADNFNNKAAFISGEGIFSSATNLVSDPVDMTTGNWTNLNTTNRLMKKYIEGSELTEVRAAAASPYGLTYQEYGNSEAEISVQAIVEINTSATSAILITDQDAAGVSRGGVKIRQHNHTVLALTSATNIGATWLNSTTVAVSFNPGADYDGSATNRLRLYGGYNYNGGISNWTRVQINNNPFPTPFSDGARSEDTITENLKMPSDGKFTIDLICKPIFRYNDSTNKVLWTWRIKGNRRIVLYYNVAVDKFLVSWKDSTTGDDRSISTAQLDDGTSYVKLNQKLRIIASIDLSASVTTGSRLILIPLETGSISEDDTWSGAIDSKVSTFNLLSIGHENKSFQANSLYERLRVYSGTMGVTVVAVSADADSIFTSMTTILNLNYQRTKYMSNISETKEFTGTSFNSLGGTRDVITIASNTTVIDLTAETYGKAIRLNWFDGLNNHSEVGRIFLSGYKSQQYATDNQISWSSKKQDNRTKQTISQAGATFFDKRTKLMEYTIPFDIMDRSYNTSTVTVLEDLVSVVENSECLYISLDSDLTASTVYGFFVGDAKTSRLSKTEVEQIKPMKFREQK